MKSEDVALKYKTSDVFTLVDIFLNIREANMRNDMEVMKSEIQKLEKYPTEIVEEFSKCLELLIEKDIDLKENYTGIVGYICLRLNLIDIS